MCATGRSMPRRPLHDRSMTLRTFALPCPEAEFGNRHQTPI
jgi:hypothetical protein